MTKHNLTVNAFCVEMDREMSNEEMAKYLRQLADMFDRQDEEKYGLLPLDIKIDMNAKKK